MFALIRGVKIKLTEIKIEYFVPLFCALADRQLLVKLKHGMLFFQLSKNVYTAAQQVCNHSPNSTFLIVSCLLTLELTALLQPLFSPWHYSLALFVCVQTVRVQANMEYYKFGDYSIPKINWKHQMVNSFYSHIAKSIKLLFECFFVLFIFLHF